MKVDTAKVAKRYTSGRNAIPLVFSGSDYRTGILAVFLYALEVATSMNKDEFQEVKLVYPKHEVHGDLTVNVMPLAKSANIPGEELADKIAATIQDGLLTPFLKSATAVGPHVNFFLSDAVLQRTVSSFAEGEFNIEQAT